MRREVIGVDAVLNHVHLAFEAWRAAQEDIGFTTGDEHVGGGPLRCAALELEQLLALAPIDVRRWPAVALGVFRPFGRVDVHQVEHEPHLR